MKEYAVPLGRCSYCRKLCFKSRKLAKRYMLSHHPEGGMTVYPCEGSEYYHYGHTPYLVKRGVKQRGQAPSYRLDGPDI